MVFRESETIFALFIAIGDSLLSSFSSNLSKVALKYIIILFVAFLASMLAQLIATLGTSHARLKLTTVPRTTANLYNSPQFQKKNVAVSVNLACESREQ